MTSEFNIGNTIFEGRNSSNGIMICGYEWGYSKKDQKADENGDILEFNRSAETTFSNKSPAYGHRAFGWKYDNRIIKWFSIFGHPLLREGLGGDFEKCILQTNWCNTEGYKIEENYHKKLTHPEQLINFLFHISEFKPSLILFMGSAMINILQDENIINKFSLIMGAPNSPPIKIQKNFNGRRFKIGFQSFPKCEIVSLPHPSSTRGLSDEYIALFAPEISQLIGNVKIMKGIC